MLDLSENFSNLSKKDILERAKKFIFSTGLNDGTSQLSKKNMAIWSCSVSLYTTKIWFKPKSIIYFNSRRNNFKKYISMEFWS
ncbi:MAG: hypothetical protein KAX33_04285 [Candidatus Lokiarchaeota archaeon]|nr:hypothetical protein [Candidatus Lokiarchaeota archaeon]